MCITVCSDYIELGTLQLQVVYLYMYLNTYTCDVNSSSMVAFHMFSV